ncbi:MAG TPA: imidazolonepropionase [Pyrinomonadaceae bacterium]
MRSLRALDQPLAIINCSQLVTLAGPARPRVGPELSELSIIADGALLVRAGKIAQVGRRTQIEAQLHGDEEIVDAGGRAMLPGFVDAHTHPVFASNRAAEFEDRARGKTYQEIAASGGGIQATVRATRSASLDELVHAGERYAQWFLGSGTTTVEAKSGYGLTLEHELKLLQAIKLLDEELPLRYVPTFLGAHDSPPEYKSRRDEYVAMLIEEMIPRVAKDALAEFCDVFCENKVFTVEESRRILIAAREHGLGIRIHADQLSLSGGARLASELRAVTADHLEHADAEGIAALESAGVQPVLLPGSVYALGSSRYPDARAMIEGGLAVVLATDFNPGSSPTPSLPMVFSIAATHMKMLPAESIVAATINAAYSLNRGEQLGSLEVGKRADFVIHDVADCREIAYFFGIQHPWRVYVDGRLAYSRA